MRSKRMMTMMKIKVQLVCSSSILCLMRSMSRKQLLASAEQSMTASLLLSYHAARAFTSEDHKKLRIYLCVDVTEGRSFWHIVRDSGVHVILDNNNVSLALR